MRVRRWIESQHARVSQAGIMIMRLPAGTSDDQHSMPRAQRLLGSCHGTVTLAVPFTVSVIISS
jgi:hypothetical protein